MLIAARSFDVNDALARRALGLAALASFFPSIRAVSSALVDGGVDPALAFLAVMTTVGTALMLVINPNRLVATWGLVLTPLLLRRLSPDASNGGDAVLVVLAIWLAPLPLLVRIQQRSQAIVKPLRTLFVWGLRWQVYVIYASAGIAKLRTAEWRSGGALTHYTADPFFGLLPAVASATAGFRAPQVAVAVFGWLVIAVEIGVAVSWLLPVRVSNILVCAAVVMHLMIGIFLGLANFSFVMLVACVIAWRTRTRNPGAATVVAGSTTAEVLV